MIIRHISRQNSILNKFIAEIRDKNIQKDRLRFRTNIKRIGQIISYELSKTLNYQTRDIITPLGTKPTNLINDTIVVASILRAALPLHTGILQFFDDADNAFISAYRKHTNDTGKFTIQVDYVASPSIKDKVLILADPMLATGKSLVAVYNKLTENETPKQLHIVSLIGAQQGIDYISENLPENAYLWIADIDQKLNDKDYIIPGLGDAGDLAFGNKI